MVQKVVLPQIRQLVGWIIGVGSIVVGLMAGYQQSMMREMQDRMAESDRKITGFIKEFSDRQTETNRVQDQFAATLSERLNTVSTILERTAQKLDMIDERGTHHEATKLENGTHR